MFLPWINLCWAADLISSQKLFHKLVSLNRLDIFLFSKVAAMLWNNWAHWILGNFSVKLKHSLVHSPIVTKTNYLQSRQTGSCNSGHLAIIIRFYSHVNYISNMFTPVVISEIWPDLFYARTLTKIQNKIFRFKFLNLNLWMPGC